MLDIRPTLLAGLFAAGAAVGAAGATALRRRRREQWDDGKLVLQDDLPSPLASADDPIGHAAIAAATTANTSPDAAPTIDPKGSSLSGPKGDAAKLAAK
jgi:hypothetical protein